MSVFSPASLSCDFVIQLQGHGTGTGNQQSNPKTISFPQPLTVKHSLCHVGTLLIMIVELSLSSSMHIFLLPSVMPCPPLPLLRQGQNSLHSFACQCCQYHVSRLEVKSSTLWTVFLKETFFSQLLLPTAKLQSRCSGITRGGSRTVGPNISYIQEIISFGPTVQRW